MSLIIPPKNLKYSTICGMPCYRNKAVVRPVADSGGRGSFSSDFGPIRGLKIGVPISCIGETSNFKIIMIDDVTLWSKLGPTL